MVKIIFGLAAFLIASFSFGLGAVKLFKKKKPLYFQILVCAAGCFALEQLSSIVNIWCEVYETFSIGLLGIFGCNFFLLSANFGTLDKIVDDGTGSKKARALAFIAPVTMAILIFGVFSIWKEQSIYSALIWVALLFPALPASYFNLKHLLLPLDAFGFLNATRVCNYSALGFYLSSVAYGAALAMSQDYICGILSVVMSLMTMALTLSAIRGVKKWGI